MRLAVTLIVGAVAGCMAWPDAPPGGDAVSGDNSTSDGPVCPEACVNDCAGGVCRLKCGKSNKPCTCPAGLACEVDCDDTNACGGVIDCTQADRCTVSCDGDGSCAGGINCGPGPCQVDCSGPGACAGGVDCAVSCGCSVEALPSHQVRCPPFCKTGCAPADGCDSCT